MSNNKRPPLARARSLACLDNLFLSTGLSAKVVRERVRIFFEARYEKRHLPAKKTIDKFFSGEIPLPLDPTGDYYTNAPSYLMALEMLFPGSTDVYFHPLFNLTAGPPRVSEKNEMDAKIYPKRWLDFLNLMRWKDMSNEMRSDNARIAQLMRERRNAWAPADVLAWLHLNMLQLPPRVRDALMKEPTGLRSTWRRRYDAVKRELDQIVTHSPMDATAAVLAMTMEAAQIGDQDRFVECRQQLDIMIKRLSQEPVLVRAYPEVEAFITTRIDDIMPRTYRAADFDKSNRYPPRWQTLISKFWYGEQPVSVPKRMTLAKPRSHADDKDKDGQ